MSVTDIQQGLARSGYVADDRLAMAIHLAQVLGRPLLLEGPAGVGKTEIAKVIRRKNRAIQRCYEAALRDNPNVGGKVGVSFVVGTAGTVTTVRVSGATGGFKSCIESKFKRIRGLPQLPAPQTFNQSYVFSKG